MTTKESIHDGALTHRLFKGMNTSQCSAIEHIQHSKSKRKKVPTHDFTT